MEVPVLLVYTIIRHQFSQRFAILAVTVLLLILLEIEYIRLEYHPKIPSEIDVFRPRERNNVVGSIFFICATIIVFAAFDYPIAVLALLLTVFGDLASALIGIKFGRTFLYREKTLEGFLAGLGMNLLVGYFLLPSYPVVYLSMAAVASVVELLTGKLDDNLTVPLISAFTGQVLIYLLNIPLSTFPGPTIGNLLKIFLP